MSTSSAIALPDASTRWRCGRCGNLTRFDVVRSERVREFWHVAMSGEASVEETEVLEHVVASVGCRWCGAQDEVELVPRPEAGGPSNDEVTGGTP